ncbi:MAG: deoxyguanosinetriphosphate triphosphohydrolase [Desulfobacteraceae bacterium]|jgi:dGTPase
MEWKRLLSIKRLGQEDTTSIQTSGRTAFESDIDRISFSTAFRRLSRKTQVHPLAANDHVHTRLTHCIEVARVGKALGKSLGQRIPKGDGDLPNDFSAYNLGAIVQAACLAHDIGNPPFGHSGERAMSHWFDLNGQQLFGSLSNENKKDIVSFEGNAQGFRVITQTENYLFFGGLRLTYATLGSFLKYPWTIRNRNDKFSIFLSEEDIFIKVAEELGLTKIDSNSWARHPLSFLVEAADDICYEIMDLEDAVELKIVQYKQVEDLLLDVFEKQQREKIKSRIENEKWHRVNFARLRGPIFDFLIEGAIDCFIEKYNEIMEGKISKSLFDLLPDNDPRKILIKSANEFSRTNIFPDQKKVEIELGAYATLECLLSSFCCAALDCGQYLQSPEGEVTLNWRSNLILKMLGDHSPSRRNPPPDLSWSKYQCLRRVLDFVSGMTDNYATYIAKQLQGMGFSGVQRP